MHHAEPPAPLQFYDAVRLLHEIRAGFEVSSGHAREIQPGRLLTVINAEVPPSAYLIAGFDSPTAAITRPHRRLLMVIANSGAPVTRTYPEWWRRIPAGSATEGTNAAPALAEEVTPSPSVAPKRTPGSTR